jgi:O-antigen ligase
MPTADLAAGAPPLSAAQGRLAQLAALGVLVHAAFLPISIAGMQIGLGVALAALVGLGLTGQRVWARSRLDLPCLVLAGAAVASLGLGALGGSPPVGWHEATLWRAILAPIVLLSALEAQAAAGDAAGPRRLALAALGVWAAAALVPGALAWPQFWAGFDPLYAMGLRRAPVQAVVPIYPERFAAVGFFRWYTRLAHNLMPPLCLAAALALHAPLRPRLRGLLAASSLVAAAAVVLTLSRAAWVGLLLALVLITVLHPSVRRWAAPLALAAALAMLLHPGVRARLAYLAVPSANDDRLEIWRVCRAVIADHPLTGVGWGNFPQRSAPYYQRLAPENLLKGRSWCHDGFLTAWAEGGPLLALALAIYWALLLAAFWRWQRGAREGLARGAAVGGLAAVVTAFANGLAHDLPYASEAMFGLGFGLAIAAALVRDAGAGARGYDAPPR